jgi:NAD(P)-dependent dehydrogenase (short-subunit alcohol dehydrogenase family)
MTAEFENKVVIVTGAGSGIGRACALKFAEAGAKVLVTDVNDAGGRETVRCIEDAGGEGIFVHVDVAQVGDIQAMVKTALDTYSCLDYLINNAGIGDNGPAPIVQHDDDDWNRVIAVNLTGVYLGMKYALPVIVQNGGAVVNIASIGAYRGAPGFPAYGASKAAMLNLTQTAAAEYGPQGVRVNAVVPGQVETPSLNKLVEIQAAAHGAEPDQIRQMGLQRIPVRRYGEPAEIAEAALWLCSSAAAFVNGHDLVVDGGRMTG